jgi:hypothetical protein
MVLLQVKDRQSRISELSSSARTSVIYHSLFDYPLKEGELIKWEVAKKIAAKTKSDAAVIHKGGYYFLKGQRGLLLKRTRRERIFPRKMKIARKIGQIINFIPTLKGVFVTGALAMGNADQKSDIDLMFVTNKGALWLSRGLTLLLLKLTGIKTRKYGNPSQEDRLCLNLWLDETALVWPKRNRNLFSAHEIAQVIPLINKNEIYERFLFANRWLKDYWPNSVRIVKPKKTKIKPLLFWLRPFEALARYSQYLYMRKKITREIIEKNKAVFHPRDIESPLLARFTTRQEKS